MKAKYPSSRRGLGVRGKLIGLLVGTAFVALLLACVAFVYYDRVTYMASKRSTLSVLTDSVAQSAYGPTAFQDPDSATTILKVLEAEPTALGGAIYTKDGQRLAAWHRSDSDFEHPATLAEAAARAAPAQRLALHREIGKDGEIAGELHVEFSTADVAARTRSFLQIAAGVLVIAVLIALVLASISQRVLTRPVAILARAAQRVQEEKDFDVRAERVSDDELGALTDAFNEMLSGIQARDAELEEHRSNLEEMVASRTRQLEARNESMRLVLDTVEQGLVTVGRDGVIANERSAAFDALLGAPPEGASFADHIARSDERAREMLKLGWDMVIEDLMPREVAIDQLPKRVVHEGKHLTIGVKPIVHGDSLDGALIMVSDVTSEVHARLEQEKQREYVAVFERVAQDRDGFVAFTTETGALLARLEEGGVSDAAAVMALVHTVKGNAAQWGVSSVANIAHELETQIVDTGVLPSDAQKRRLFDAWATITKRFGAQLGAGSDRIEVSRADLTRVISAARAHAPHHEIADGLEALKHEPTRVRFARMADDLVRLARRLEKPEPKVVIEANGVRLPASRFGGFWASTVHVLRNVMDHGVETAEERRAASKPEAGTIVLRSTVSDDCFTIELQDDGRGIDWDAIAIKARAAGMPAETRADLERALFSSGISTAANVTDISGRGVGLSAVLERCTALGGAVKVTSSSGAGTCFSFSFPRRLNEHSLVPMRRAG